MEKTVEKIICPVCDYPEVTTNICPHCQTDLTTIRILENLPFLPPVNTEQKKSFLSTSKLLIIITLILIVGGLTIYFVSDYYYRMGRRALDLDNQNPEVIIKKVEESKQKLQWCGGFNYRIKSGDSLYLLALRFYGDGDAWRLITQANPSITSPQNLQIGQVILIPNLAELCQNIEL